MAMREYLTAIAIREGIIQLIKPNGEIGYYRQRGIDKYLQSCRNLLEVERSLIKAGILAKDWKKYPELPRNWSISFEDPEIMGRAYATFNPDRESGR